MSSTCRGCGGPIARRGKYGYCSRNRSCNAKRQRASYADPDSPCRAQTLANVYRRNPEHVELTYLAYSERMRLHKVGHSRRLSARLTVIRSGCPDARIVRKYHHDRELERYLRHQLASCRFLESDWYDLEKIGGLAAVDGLVATYEATLAKTQEKAA